MTADFLTSFFSHVCGRGHCFEVGGVALPVCQRCLGLYAGAAITGAYWCLTKGWRRGLPSLWVTMIQIAMLVTALLGGVHVLDFGEKWRFLCGLWTGHVALLWLTGAANGLQIQRIGSDGSSVWRRRDQLLVFVLIGGISILPWLVSGTRMRGRLFWEGIAVLGFLFLGLAFLYAILITIWRIKRASFTNRVKNVDLSRGGEPSFPVPGR